MKLFDKLSTAVKRPDRIYPFVSRNVFRALGYINWGILNKGIRVMDHDWDTLIILDACRYEHFKKVNFLDGNLMKVISMGSSSGQFLEQNFGGREFPDTVMISANDFLRDIDAGFFSIYEQYDDEEYKRPYFPQLEDTGLSTHPEETIELAYRAYTENPNKRLIVHFLPPHVPHYTDIAREVRKRGYSIRSAFVRGELSIELVRRSYKENTKFVLEYAEQLANNIPGKTIITSDHANLFNEYGIKMHPRKVYAPELVRVPWFEINTKERREIKRGNHVEYTSEMTEKNKDNLRNLGYIDI